MTARILKKWLAAGQGFGDLPTAPWPAWARAMRFLSRPADRGLGDTIARIVGPVGGDAFKAWHLATFGVPCGCEGRQESLNREFPFPAEPVTQTALTDEQV